IAPAGNFVAPGEGLLDDTGMKQLLEPVELARVAEDDLRDPAAIGTGGADDFGTESRGELAPHLRIGTQETVHDLVARDGRGAVPGKSIERRALAGADGPGDRDRDRTVTCGRSRCWRL